MDLSGLSKRMFRKDFRFGTYGKREIRPIITTKKSSTFQGSLKYDFLCKIKPKAIILRIASAVYI